MKATYTPNSKFQFELEVKNVEGFIEEIGPIQELMSACVCGRCGGTSIIFSKRTVDKFDYYELQCMSPVGENKWPCKAKLSLGKDQETKQLFPRRYEVERDKKSDNYNKAKKDKDGKIIYLKNNGWLKWNETTGENE